MYISCDTSVQATDINTIISLNENDYQVMAGVTGLEPATSCVTGKRSNQTELHPHLVGGKGLEPMTLSV